MSQEKHRPYVPETVQMREFTLRAVLIGLVLTVILGAANAYLGLRAGMTIAATYPAAVISMAVLRLLRGSILEENIARTVGSIGESVAAGAIFTIPAFVISRAWPSFDFEHAYWKSSVLMLVGGVLGILFVTLLRRVMVEDPELPFPESVAASEIHKAGQQGSKAAKILFYNMGLGALVYLLGVMQLFAASKEFFVHIGQIGKSLVRLGSTPESGSVGVGGVTMASAPGISPAYLGVGYIIGPRLAALNFSGGVVAWGLLVPLLIYFLGPQLQSTLPPGAVDDSWSGLANAIWRFIVRPIAVGGMLVGASYTLFKMRKSLAIGMKRAVSDLKKAGAQAQATSRTDRDLGAKTVFGGLAVTLVCMIAPVHLLLGHAAGRSRRGGRHARARILLRGCLRQPGGHDRLLQQPGLGADAFDAHRGGAVDGHHRRFRSARGGGRARRRRGGLRILRRGRRDAPGSQSGPHSRRHSPQHADRGFPGGLRRQRPALLPAPGSSPGQHQRGRHRLWGQGTFGSSGRTDGFAGARHRGRRHALAAGRRRRSSWAWPSSWCR